MVKSIIPFSSTFGNEYIPLPSFSCIARNPVVFCASNNFSSKNLRCKTYTVVFLASDIVGNIVVCSCCDSCLPHPHTSSKNQHLPRNSALCPLSVVYGASENLKINNSELVKFWVCDDLGITS